MDLRYYQADCIQGIYDYIRNHNGNPVAVVPTGGGKTPIMGTIINDAVTNWGGRVLVLAHVKELLEQAEKTAKSVNLNLDVGVYSAGLKRKQTKQPVIVAGIQSVYQKAGELGAFDLILLDEAHLVPPDGEGRYRTFLDNARIVNPNVRFVGLTATPYRLGSGLIYGQDRFFNDVCYEVGVKELIAGGYLSPLVSKRGLECDTSKLTVKGGEFIDGEVADLMMANVDLACAEVLKYTENRKSTLVFAAGLDHAAEVCERLVPSGRQVSLITGETPAAERAEIIEQFKAGEIAYLVNVGVLTTGFDAPNVDCVVLLRATLSPGLYYQMVGRGFRLSPGKQDCLILDFGGNVERHGPVDQIEVKHVSNRKGGKGEAPTKVCPQCNTVVISAFRSCPECQHEFTVDKPKHESASTSSSVLSGEITHEEVEVLDTVYSAHRKKGADDDAPKTLRVDYFWGPGPWDKHSEWICVEHPEGSWAQKKAIDWWYERTDTPFVSDAAEAARLANAGCLSPATSITVRKVSGEKFSSIASVSLNGRVVGFEPDSIPSERGWDDGEPEPIGAAAEQGAFRWGAVTLSDDEVPF